jgi:hypothetical protein
VGRRRPLLVCGDVGGSSEPVWAELVDADFSGGEPGALSEFDVISAGGYDWRLTTAGTALTAERTAGGILWTRVTDGRGSLTVLIDDLLGRAATPRDFFSVRVYGYSNGASNSEFFGGIVQRTDANATRLGTGYLAGTRSSGTNLWAFAAAFSTSGVLADGTFSGASVVASSTSAIVASGLVSLATGSVGGVVAGSTPLPHVATSTSAQRPNHGNVASGGANAPTVNCAGAALNLVGTAATSLVSRIHIFHAQLPA